MIKTPSPSYSIIIRLEIVSKPGMLGKVTSTIGRAGGDIGAVDIVGFKKNLTIRDIIVSVADIPMGEKVVNELRRIKGANILQVTDRTFMVHQGGKIEIKIITDAALLCIAARRLHRRCLLFRQNTHPPKSYLPTKTLPAPDTLFLSPDSFPLSASVPLQPHYRLASSG
jgi:hypothetical protein